jgi:hypothetical protein
MAAWIEDGIVVFLFYAIEAQRLVELSFGIGVLQACHTREGPRSG